jgi:hypothetical protein
VVASFLMTIGKAFASNPKWMSQARTTFGLGSPRKLPAIFFFLAGCGSGVGLRGRAGLPWTAFFNSKASVCKNEENAPGIKVNITYS